MQSSAAASATALTVQPGVIVVFDLRRTCLRSPATLPPLLLMGHRSSLDNSRSRLSAILSAPATCSLLFLRIAQPISPQVEPERLPAKRVSPSTDTDYRFCHQNTRHSRFGTFPDTAVATPKTGIKSSVVSALRWILPFVANYYVRVFLLIDVHRSRVASQKRLSIFLTYLL